MKQAQYNRGKGKKRAAFGSRSTTEYRACYTNIVESSQPLLCPKT